jgi:hypothetical protein
MAHIMQVGNQYYKYETFKQEDGSVKRKYLGKVTKAEFDLFMREKKLAEIKD